jgi:hypothetical protein
MILMNLARLGADFVHRESVTVRGVPAAAFMAV